MNTQYILFEKSIAVKTPGRFCSGLQIEVIRVSFQRRFFKIAKLILQFLSAIHCNQHTHHIRADCDTQNSFQYIYATYVSVDGNKGNKIFCACHYVKVVRNETGNCSETMYRQSWNVEEFIGRHVQVTLVMSMQHVWVAFCINKTRFFICSQSWKLREILYRTILIFCILLLLPSSLLHSVQPMNSCTAVSLFLVSKTLGSKLLNCKYQNFKCFDGTRAQFLLVISYET